MLTAGWIEFLAGTSGGIASVVVGHPFDTIKTRLQLQASHSPSSEKLKGVPLLNTRYTSAYNALIRIVREERVIGLYKGLLPPMAGVAAMNASIFYLYNASLSILQGSHQPSAKPMLLETFCAGVMSGIGSSLITSPLELFKIQQQADLGTNQQIPYTEAIRKVWRAAGIRGFYHGLGATCIRDIGYGPYFVTYSLLTRWFSASEGPNASSLSNGTLAVAGALAGVVAWVSTYWADAVKTRIQAMPIANFHKPTPGFWQVLKTTYRQEGIAALFAGVSTTIMRAIPTNAALFVMYEMVKRELNSGSI